MTILGIDPGPVQSAENKSTETPVRKLTHEESMAAWTQFAAAAIQGLLAAHEDSRVLDEDIGIACNFADAMREQWETRMEQALEIDHGIED